MTLDLTCFFLFDPILCKLIAKGKENKSEERKKMKTAKSHKSCKVLRKFGALNLSRKSPPAGWLQGIPPTETQCYGHISPIYPHNNCLLEKCVKTIIVYYEKNNCSTYFRSPKVL
jgi:hypothetical protein